MEYTFQFKICSVLVEAPSGFRFGPSTAEGLRRNPESISEVTCQLKICSDLVEAPCGFRFGPSTADALRVQKGPFRPERALRARKGPLGPGRGPWGPEGALGARKGPSGPERRAGVRAHRQHRIEQARRASRRSFQYRLFALNMYPLLSFRSRPSRVRRPRNRCIQHSAQLQWAFRVRRLDENAFLVMGRWSRRLQDPSYCRWTPAAAVRGCA